MTMMNTRAFVSIAIVATLASGCVTHIDPPPEGLDYGAKPTNYEQRIISYMESRLKDPESARYKFEKPRTAYVLKGLFQGQGIASAGYKVNFELNSKNGFGGYVGYKPYFAYFVNDDLYKVAEGHSHPLVVTTFGE